MSLKITRRSLVKTAAAGLALTMPTVLGACSSTSGNAEGASSSASAGEQAAALKVYLWDTNLVRDLAPYIHEQLPDKNIEFIAGNNDVDLYNYLLEHGELPDVMTVRRFAGTEARALRPYLLDFDSYDVVSEFSSYSLQYYRSDNGETNWLPVCGIPQTIIANKTLFEENDLQLPESYDEYAQVCQALNEKGIKPYALDLAADWSSHEMVQAGGIGELTSLDGISWRSQAESAEGDIEFDDALWTTVFEQAAKLLSDSCLTQDDLSVDTNAAMAMFTEGKAAMFHGSPVHFKQCQEAMPGQTLVRVPYFSQTSNEGYIYMTPSQHVALNKDLENDAEKLELALSVLDCMLSVEGQKLIANGGSVISFNPAVASITDGMVGLESEVSNNQYYIRYSAQKSFAASVAAVTGLLTQKMDAAQAYQAFREAINAADGAAGSTATFENDYALALNQRHGRDAASAILGTVREQAGAQLALSPYCYFTAPIHKGECSDTRANLLVTRSEASELNLVELTGAQVKDLVRKNLAGESGYFVPASVYELPIASGAKLVVEKGDAGFTLNNVLVDGSAIEGGKTYSVLLADGLASDVDAAAKLDLTLPDAWAKAVSSGRQPAEPEDYIEVRV